MIDDTELKTRLEAQTAPKVTPERIAEVIASTTFLRPTGTLTICVLTLANGFTVTGESACASPENYSQDIGEKIAYDNAKEKIWLLEGYALRDRLHHQAVTRSSGPQPGEDLNQMDIGLAVLLMRAGKRVARPGWNGKGMFLYFVPAASYPAQTGAAKRHYGEQALVPYQAYIAMKTADGNVVPWLSSQTDLLANDWQVLEDDA